MKKIILVFAALWCALMLSGCAPVQWGIGMSENDFLQRNKGKGVKVAEATTYRTVYQKCQGWNCAYYYFQNGYLIQADNGTTQPDIVIQNR